MAVRKYKIAVCPTHGRENMHNGYCLVVLKRTPDRITRCYDGMTVTAYDECDVEPLVKAARGCLPEGDDLHTLGFREVPGSRLRALADALAPFEQSEEES